MGGTTIAETCIRNNYLIVDLPRESLTGYSPRAALKSLQHAHNMRCAATYTFLHSAQNQAVCWRDTMH